MSATNRNGTVAVEISSWITKFVGGDGSGRRVIDVPASAETTVRSVLETVSGQYPDLRQALWHGRELGEHIEVLVNDAVLGVKHSLESSLRAGDRITLLAQYMGGSS